jgi:hypothetical protein
VDGELRAQPPDDPLRQFSGRRNLARLSAQFAALSHHPSTTGDVRSEFARHNNFSANLTLPGTPVRQVYSQCEHRTTHRFNCFSFCRDVDDRMSAPTSPEVAENSNLLTALPHYEALWISQRGDYRTILLRFAPANPRKVQTVLLCVGPRFTPRESEALMGPITTHWIATIFGESG